MVHYCENPNCGLPFNRLTKKEKFCHKCRKTGEAYYRKIKPIEKTCIVCGTKFVSHYSRKVYCSKECREAADTRGNAPILKECEFCGTEFKTTDSRKRYCSKNCYRNAKKMRSKKNADDND